MSITCAWCLASCGMFLHWWSLKGDFSYAVQVADRGGEKRLIPHRLISLLYSFRRLIILGRVFCCFCFVAGPILYPYPNEEFLEFKVSFSSLATNSTLFPLLCPHSWIIPSPLILNSVSPSKTQRRILSPLPLHIFKKGKMVKQTGKAVKW